MSLRRRRSARNTWDAPVFARTKIQTALARTKSVRAETSPDKTIKRLLQPSRSLPHPSRSPTARRFSRFVQSSGLSGQIKPNHGGCVVSLLLLLLLLLSASAVVGWFWIDIISCLPISYMQSLGMIAKESNSPADKTKFFRILRLLRLTKLLRLARFKRMLEVSEPKTPIFLLFNSLFLLFSFSQFSFRWFYQDWLGTNVRKTNSTKKRLRLKKYKISVMRRTSRRSLQDSRSARRFC